MNRNDFHDTHADKEAEFAFLAERKIDVLPVITKYILHWRWFLISLILVVLLALFYIWLTPPSYLVTTSILFRDDLRGGATEMNIHREMGLITRRNSADNEVEILNKSLVAESVVRKLNLYVAMHEMKPLAIVRMTGLERILPALPRRDVGLLYGDQSPLTIQPTEECLSRLEGKSSFTVKITPGGDCLFSGKSEEGRFQVKADAGDTLVRLPLGDFRILRREIPRQERLLKVTIRHPLEVADLYLANLDVELTSKTSSVADISFVSPNGEMGKAFLAEYVNSYNEQGIRVQLELAEKTSALVDDHLTKLSEELSSVETLAQNYKQSQGLTDIASQADLYNVQLASAGQRKADVESQHTIVNKLLQHVQQKEDHRQLIPANSGVMSEVLNTQINLYNGLVLERNKLSRIASNSNQSMIDLNSQLESTLSSVRSGLQSERQNLEIQLNDINTLYYRNNARVRAIPRQERVFSDIKRQQNIKEELFLYLLQKKEERYMNMTTVEPSSRLVDNIRLAGIVWPRKTMILLIATILGLLFPVVLIKVRELLRSQVESREDIEAISSIPLLGEISMSNHKEPVLVGGEETDSFNEMMRLLRANLLFVLNREKEKVINILSGLGGEGKTFVSLNLAMSLALLDKRVVVVELDIRKPVIARLLGLDAPKGITHYLSGYADVRELLLLTSLHPNLWVVTAGRIPPNPNELLAKPALDTFVDGLKQQFDFVIIDTSPIGMVSDAFLLNRLADVNLCVIRAGSTPRRFVEDMERSHRQEKLKRLYFILNGVSHDRVAYRYSFYKRYGYGYKPSAAAKASTM